MTVWPSRKWSTWWNFNLNFFSSRGDLKPQMLNVLLHSCTYLTEQNSQNCNLGFDNLDPVQVQPKLCGPLPPKVLMWPKSFLCACFSKWNDTFWMWCLQLTHSLSLIVFQQLSASLVIFFKNTVDVEMHRWASGVKKQTKDQLQFQSLSIRWCCEVRKGIEKRVCTLISISFWACLPVVKFFWQ